MINSYKLFSLGDVKLQSNKVLKNASMAYKTYGTLNDDRSNVIVYPTWFTGFISDNEWLIGKGMALDPSKYFIIIVAAFGNGESTSPSNYNNFPNVTLYDNVTSQYRLITELFKINKIKLVVGWSMGAQQTFQWACLYPDMIENFAPLCGSAKTAHHNFVFLEGVKAPILSNCEFKDGAYTKKPVKALKGVARVYAGWGFSQPFYKEEKWRDMGFKNLEDFLVNFWEKFFLLRDPNNLLAMLWTWQNANISDNHIFNGNLEAALGAIKSKSYVMPAHMDLYFPPEDSAWEVEHMKNSNLIVIPGIWGHFAADGLNKTDTKFIDDNLKLLIGYSKKNDDPPATIINNIYKPCSAKKT